MATVDVYAHDHSSASWKRTGFTVVNGDEITIVCGASDKWGLQTGDLSKECNADGLKSFDKYYDKVSGLTEYYGALCGKLDTQWFLVGTALVFTASGLSGPADLGLYCHDSNYLDNYGYITVTITKAQLTPSNAMMFSCNT